VTFRDQLFLLVFRFEPLDGVDDPKTRSERTLQAIEAAQDITYIMCARWGHVPIHDDGDAPFVNCARCSEWYEAQRRRR